MSKDLDKSFTDLRQRVGLLREAVRTCMAFTEPTADEKAAAFYDDPANREPAEGEPVVRK